jgi:hypothetical protein
LDTQRLIYFDFTANADAQLLTVPPYACAAIVITIFSFFSDRIQSRGIFIAIASLIAGIGYMYVISTCSKGSIVVTYTSWMPLQLVAHRGIERARQILCDLLYHLVSCVRKKLFWQPD